MWQLLNLCVGPIFTPEKKSEKGRGMFLMYCEILNTPIFYQYSCQQEWVIESKYAQRFYMNFRYSLPTDTQYHCYWNFLLKYAEFILESELKNLNWLKYTCEFSFVLFFPFPFLFFFLQPIIPKFSSQSQQTRKSTQLSSWNQGMFYTFSWKNNYRWTN